MANRHKQFAAVPVEDRTKWMRYLCSYYPAILEEFVDWLFDTEPIEEMV